jgi:hypothetical protein
MHVPTRSGYKELGLELVSLEEKISRMPKRPLMVGENKDDGTRDPFKMFLEESLMQQRNEMMDSFAQILRTTTNRRHIFLERRRRPLQGTNQL